ncbi:MAG: nucleotidyl transferase AbiEii/AbiGii toxin family protein [Candidatus Omnitrophota bacterium]|nr:nucleotidyl transferase AbiEii/AbiGii toxin family protein [Candidatus Omnitrophota bacterium]
MDVQIRKAQEKVLKELSKKQWNFALAGGTALELFYLHHRFSADLDFFSPAYVLKEIDEIISELAKSLRVKIKLEAEFVASRKARVRFYYMPVKAAQRPLKIDFVEDVLFSFPRIEIVNGIRLYSVENIYLQKISAITGAGLEKDAIGRDFTEGRREARDIFDIYMLSKKICALHIFLRKQPSHMQRGMVHWYQTYSRQDTKLALLDMDIYDKNFDSKDMITYLDGEIKKFIEQVLE